MKASSGLRTMDSIIRLKPQKKLGDDCNVTKTAVLMEDRNLPHRKQSPKLELPAYENNTNENNYAQSFPKQTN